MKTFRHRLFSALLPLLAAGGLTLLGLALPAAAQLAGSITNASTGQPAAGVPVVLLNLQGTMQPVENTTSDSQGHFHFSQGPTDAPMLVEAQFQKVPYFSPVRPGDKEVKLTVEKAVSDPALLQVVAQVRVVQPTKGQLAVVDEYQVVNNHQPPITLYRAGGMFRLRVPEGGKPDGARVIGPEGMPITRDVSTAGAPGSYGIDYPIRPGESHFQVSYRMPYPGNQASFNEKLLYPNAHFQLYVPAAMQVSGAGLRELGQQEGYRIYEAADTHGALHYSVSGTAPMPAAATAGGAASAGGGSGAATAGSDNSAASSFTSGAPAPPPANPEVGGLPVKTPLETNLLPIASLLGLACLAALFFLWTRRGTTAAAAAPLSADLTKLKDELFLLEVRKQTGDVSESEYAERRRSLEQRLARLAAR